MRRSGPWLSSDFRETLSCSSRKWKFPVVWVRINPRTRRIPCPTTKLWCGQKVAILKRYLVDKVPISDLCDEYGIKPNQVYAWQKVLFEHGDAAFEQAGGRVSEVAAKEEKIVRLEAKLQQKNEVISELMEENVREKKANGEL